jgi:multiple sugar transport system ATP-binding protein
MAQVSLENVSKVFFGGTEAVRDLSLGVENKEFMVLVGPSGCGKSTTLRMIAGLEEATSGDIYIGDTLVNEVPAKDRDIAMVFQTYALYPHMTAFENMAFGLKLRRYPVKEITQRVTEAAEILSIRHL